MLQDEQILEFLKAHKSEIMRRFTVYGSEILPVRPIREICGFRAHGFAETAPQAHYQPGGGLCIEIHTGR